MPSAKKNEKAITKAIIGPAHPGAWHALMACYREIGEDTDRTLFPWELVDESPLVFNAVLKATRKFLQLHVGIETVYVFTRPGFGQVAGRMVDALYAYAAEHQIRLRVQMEILNVNGDVPSATVFTCGDGRDVFWRTFGAVHERYGTPRIFAVPGEEQWFANNPGVAGEIDGWLRELPGRQKRVTVKHGGPPCAPGEIYSGCGYRRVAHPQLATGTPDMERAIALTECSRSDTDYLWAPGYGSELLQELRPRLS